MRDLRSRQTLNIGQTSFPYHCFVIALFFTGFYSLWFLTSLISGELLAPQDGFIQSIPAYYVPRSLWTTQLLGGFPVAADVTPQTWYPILLLISLLPNSWNIFVISSYVLASLFSYAYVFVITRSVMAGLVSGLIYGASGFMMARLGHTSIIHTASWIPFVLLCCEQLIRSNRKYWVALLSIGIACLFLAGHPQISFYGLGLVGLYAVFLGRLQPHRWTFYVLFILAIVLGLGLAGIQLIPTAELAQMTPRNIMSFQEFVAYSVPLSHVVLGIFPYIFGGSSLPPYKLSTTGLFPPGDIPIYVGILPLILAVVGAQTGFYSKSLRYFWVSITILSFLLVLGPITPLAWMTYQVPIYNKFRILSRHSVELAMAVSVLAGLGISAIQKQQVNGRYLKQITRSSILIMGLMMIWAIGAGAYFWNRSNPTAPLAQMVDFLLPSILFPLTIFVLGLVSLNGYAGKIHQGQSNIAAVSLLSVLIMDLGMFGWFCNWQDSPKASELFATPPFLQNYQVRLQQSSQRVFPLRGGQGAYGEIPPNLSRIWNAPNMSGYGPLLLSRVAEFMSISPAGSLISMKPLSDSQNRSFDLTAVRYLTTSAATDSSPPIMSEHWKYLEELGAAKIYENLNVLPRAWLTSQVHSLNPVEILAAVKTSILPNGDRFEPRTAALIEEPIDFPDQISDPSATVKVEFPSETQVRLQTQSKQPTFLVISDVFYPGWQVHIDGKVSHIFQTDYILRGVQLTAGEHVVVLSFRPMSFTIGCATTGTAFAVVVYLLVSKSPIKI